MVKTVLLLATTTGYQIRSFGEAAQKLGIRLVFASDRCDQLDDPWYDHAIPVRFHEPHRSCDAIADAFADSAPDGVVAVGDRPAGLAAMVAAHFGIPGNSPASAAASSNKLSSRTAFQEAGLPVPSFRAVPLTADEQALGRDTSYPAVLKPLALSGSRGVIRANGPSEFVDAFNRLRKLMESADVLSQRDNGHGQLLIESFVPGREFALEGVLTAGELQTLAIFDKPDPLDGPFFEETIYLTPTNERARVQEEIALAVSAAARALGLRHGPVHAECRVNVTGVYVLEVAARPIGGLCSRVLRFDAHGGGIATLEEVLLRHAVGEDVTRYTRESNAAGVMMIPIPKRGIYRGVEGVGHAASIAGIEDVQITAKPDALLVPLPEGKSYLGFIFARADDPKTVEQALRTAHSRLRFVIERELTVVSAG